MGLRESKLVALAIDSGCVAPRHVQAARASQRTVANLVEFWPAHTAEGAQHMPCRTNRQRQSLTFVHEVVNGASGVEPMQADSRVAFENVEGGALLKFLDDVLQDRKHYLGREIVALEQAAYLVGLRGRSDTNLRPIATGSQTSRVTWRSSTQCSLRDPSGSLAPPEKHEPHPWHRGSAGGLNCSHSIFSAHDALLLGLRPSVGS
jgi:hypothetical protein